MNVLVVYATKTGVTEDIAKRLKESSKQSLDVVSVKACTNEQLMKAEAFVLGAGVYIGKLHRKMRSFMKRHASRLLEKPLLMYVCAGEPEENLDDVLEISVPKNIQDHASRVLHTGGQFRYERMKPLTRWLIKAVQKNRDDASEPTINEQAIKRLIEAVDTL